MSFYINNKDAIPCKRCGSPTQMHGTKLCDPCWEKDRRGVFDLQDEVDHLRAERDKAEAALRASRPALTKDGERIIRQFLACYEKGYWLGMDPNTITRQALAEVCEAVLARMEIDRLRAERDKAEAALREVAEWCSHDGLFRDQTRMVIEAALRAHGLWRDGKEDTDG